MKLNKMDKLEIVLCVIGLILALAAMIIIKDIMWVTVALLWLSLGIEKYSNKKLINMHKIYELTLERFVENQKETIRLLEEKNSYMEKNEKCK